MSPSGLLVLLDVKLFKTSFSCYLKQIGTKSEPDCMQAPFRESGDSQNGRQKVNTLTFVTLEMRGVSMTKGKRSWTQDCPPVATILVHVDMGNSDSHHMCILENNYFVNGRQPVQGRFVNWDEN